MIIFLGPDFCSLIKTPLTNKTKIFFATKNKSKWDYFGRWCELVEYERLTPLDFDKNIWPEFIENGKTLEENAIIKAKNWSKIIKEVYEELIKGEEFQDY